MANEIRIRRNNIAGTITDNPLTNVATTINSPGFVDLPTVDATSHLILILDPLELAGPAEIVRVTTHTAAASVVTVVRGAEGSAARTHSFGTTWFHGPVTTDWEEVLTSSTRPAVPYTGEALYETDTLKTMRYSGTAWGQNGLLFDPPACRIFNTASQSLPNNTITALTFNSERFDTDSMHSTAVNTSRITFNTAGLYHMWGNVSVTGEADYTSLSVIIRLNGTTSIGQFRRLGNGDGSPDQPTFQVTSLYKVVATDYIELLVIQENTSANAEDTVVAGNTSPEFGAIWVGRGNNV